VAGKFGALHIFRVKAVEAILKSNSLNYSTVNASKLNDMGESQIPAVSSADCSGGNLVEMGTGLTPGATTNIRNAVQEGLNYLGICAHAGGVSADHPTCFPF
jgi:glutamine amidotransferase-like uncharacterized protein